MKTLFLSLLATLGEVSASGMLRLADHTDITPFWNTATSSWSWSLVATNSTYAPGQTYFPVRDLSAGQNPFKPRDGDRYLRSASANFNFIGVAAGEPIWILPMSDNGQAWPGFGDTQSNTFASYTETDTRVSGSAPWLRLQLSAVDGPAGGFFSLYSSSSLVWMRTDNGIDINDVFIKPFNHAHANWCFTKKGLWRVRMTVSGFQGPGASNPTPTSAELPIYFAIGAFAEWRASRFSGPDAVNPAIGGDLADQTRTASATCSNTPLVEIHSPAQPCAKGTAAFSPRSSAESSSTPCTTPPSPTTEGRPLPFRKSPTPPSGRTDSLPLAGSRVASLLTPRVLMLFGKKSL